MSNGELMDNGFNFAEKSDMYTEASYSHSNIALNGDCKAWSCTVRIAPGSVTGYRDVSTDSEQVLTSTVAQQPMSIAEAGTKTLL